MDPRGEGEAGEEQSTRDSAPAVAPSSVFLADARV
jgi:hypothetical protein